MRSNAAPLLNQLLRSYSCASPHEALGVSQNATTAQIRDSYVRLAKQHHPDRGGSTERFVQIQTAYATLRSPQARTASQQHEQTRQTHTGSGEARAAWSLGCSLLATGSGMGAAAFWARRAR